MNPGSSRENFVPALAYRFLTPLYDPIVRLTTREHRFKQTLIDQAGIRPGMRVLDLGCGTGTLTIWAKEQEQGAEFVGVDGDPEMLNRASSKAEKNGLQLTFMEGMSFELPFADDSFDRVVSSLFFHHLVRSDKQRTLEEIRRVIRPDGELHIADWGRPEGRLMKALSFSIRKLDGAKQTEDNLEGNLPVLIEEAGLTRVRNGPSFRTIYGTMQLLSAQVSTEARIMTGENPD